MSEYQETDLLAGAKTLTEILNTTYPPTEYIVPGVIPQGSTLLVAGSKVGKSWLMLQVGIECASGGKVLGQIQVPARPVLYLALEDDENGVQERANILGRASGDNVDNLYLLIQPGGTITATIAAFLERHSKDKPLVILDTLGRAKGVYTGNDAYGNDYAIGVSMKTLVDAHPGSGIIAVHHTNKSTHDDWIHSINGTTGLAGAADTIVMIQRGRNEEKGKLNVTGRRVRENTYGLQYNDGAWTLDGDSLEEAAKAVAFSADQQDMSGDMIRVWQVVQMHPRGIKPKDVSLATGLKADKVRLYLRRLVEDEKIKNPFRGLYTPVTSVTIDTFPSQGREAGEEPPVTSDTSVTPTDPIVTKVTEVTRPQLSAVPDPIVTKVTEVTTPEEGDNSIGLSVVDTALPGMEEM